MSRGDLTLVSDAAAMPGKGSQSGEPNETEAGQEKRRGESTRRFGFDSFWIRLGILMIDRPTKPIDRLPHAPASMGSVKSTGECASRART